MSYLFSWFTSLFVYVFFLFFRALPIEMASAVGGWLLRIIGPFTRFHKVAKTNLRMIYPSWSDQQYRANLALMWDNLGRTVGEIPHIPVLNQKDFDKRVKLEGVENIELWQKLNPQGMIYSAHLANWELLLRISVRLDRRLALVYRRPNMPLVHRFILNIRSRQNSMLELIPKGVRGVKQLMRAIQEGHSIGMLMDQKLNEGMEIDFMGHPAMTADNLAALARRYNMPILPVQIVRIHGANFKVIVHPPVQVDKTSNDAEDIKRAVIQINNTIGQWVNEHPEQWLWVHRRWKREY